MPNLSNILQQFLQQYQQARTTQIGEKRTGLATLERAAGLFGPGFGADVERRAIASAGQQAVSAGLSGTTVPGARAGRISAGFETERRTKRATALSNIAQYQAQFQPITPQPTTIAPLAQAVEQRRARVPDPSVDIAPRFPSLAGRYRSIASRTGGVR